MQNVHALVLDSLSLSALSLRKEVSSKTKSKYIYKLLLLFYLKKIP